MTRLMPPMPVVDNDLFKGAEEQQHLVGHAFGGVPDGAEPPLFVQRRVGAEIVTERNPNDGLEAALGEILYVSGERVDPHRELQDGNERELVPVRLTDVICREGRPIGRRFVNLLEGLPSIEPNRELGLRASPGRNRSPASRTSRAPI